MIPMRILVSGTPGVGKTTFSSQVSERFKIPHVEMSRYIKDNELYVEYDEKYSSFVYDDEVVKESLKTHLLGMNSYIIDTHSCGVVDDVDFDLIFILTSPVEVLYQRLKERGYDDLKIKENIECEIFGVVREEMEDLFGSAHVIGDEGLTLEEAMEMIGRRMKS